MDIDAYFDDEDIQNVYIPLLKELDEIQKRKKERIYLFIGACPGTGKTTLVLFLEWLSKQIGINNTFQCLGLDGFHYPNSYLMTHTIKENGKEICMMDRKGGPETFDVEALKEKIIESKQVNNLWPIYSRIDHDVKEDAIQCTANIILLEGNYLLCNDERYNILEGLWDKSLLILEDEKVLQKRLWNRKIKGGLTQEQATRFCEASDYKNISYVLNTYKQADIILIMDNYKLIRPKNV